MTAEQTALVEDYAAMVAAIARKVQVKLYFQYDFEELVSEGYVGLCQAAIRWDSENTNSFRTYSYYRIYGAMIDYVRKQRKNSSQRSKEQDEFTHVSLSQPISYSENSDNVGDMLEADGSFDFDSLSVFSILKERERTIMFRWAICGDRQQEIADDYGITESRVSQILKRARSKMKTAYENTAT
jgi:RNA polymerase sigma factor (sigma-70 family)